jgi:hypothetical protein
MASRKKPENPIPPNAVAPNAAKLVREIAAAKAFTDGPQTRIAEALGLPDSSLPNKWWRGKVGIGAASAVLLREKFPEFSAGIDRAVEADSALKRAAAEKRARAPRTHAGAIGSGGADISTAEAQAVENLGALIAKIRTEAARNGLDPEHEVGGLAAILHRMTLSGWDHMRAGVNRGVSVAIEADLTARKQIPPPQTAPPRQEGIA